MMENLASSPLRTTDGTEQTAVGWMVPADSTWKITAMAVGHQVGGVDNDVVFEQTVVVRRKGTGAPIVKAQGPSSLLPGNSPYGVSPRVLTVDDAVQGTIYYLTIYVTGKAGHTVDWNTRFEGFGIVEGQAM